MSNVISRRLSFCALVGALAAACTIAPPPQAEPTPAPTPKDSVGAPSPVTARWTPQRSASSWHYELRSTGAVSLSGDTTASSLPLDRTVFYTVSIVPTGSNSGGGSFQMSGSVDSVAVTVPERIPTPTAGSNSKPHFQGVLAADGHVLAISSNASTACANATDPLSAGATLLFVALPQGLSPADTWTDSVSTTTCRGRMPLITTATRHYTAITDTVWHGREAILIARTDSLLIRNRPDTTTDSTIASGNITNVMEAAGNGFGEFRLYVDPRSGALLEAIGTSRTEILVTTGSSRFPFHEEARQTIILLK